MKILIILGAILWPTIWVIAGVLIGRWITRRD